VESIRTEREAKRRYVGLRYQLLPAVTAVSIGVPNLTPHRLTVESAERVGRRIVDAYLAPDKTFVELRDMLDTGSIDILGEFSEACRVEFESLRAQQF
jgi:hypothetical protein